jgi:hypothetical protein
VHIQKENAIVIIDENARNGCEKHCSALEIIIQNKKPKKILAKPNKNVIR